MFDLRQFAAIAPECYQKLHWHEQLESTNDEAQRLADEGAEHGTVVLAEYQTRGRGRRGAGWMCEPGDGLLFSVVLRPQFGKDYYGRIALVAGLGIASVLIDELAIPARVKWPNDIQINGKKCCGVLVEANNDCVVLGVGLNVLNAPGDDGFIAINDVVSEPVSREKILALVLAAVMREVDQCAEDFSSQLNRIEAISWLNGKNITFLSAGHQHQGTAEGIAEDGSLIVRTNGGVRQFAQASDIRCVN